VTPARRANPTYNQGMLVDIIVYDGVDEMDALGPLEVLRKVQSLRDDFEVRLLSPTGQKKVRGAAGLVFSTDGPFEPTGAEVVVVPGGGWVARAPVGAWGEHLRGELEPQLVAAAANARIMAGVCTGTMLLAHAGVIEGRRASTHHAALGELAALGVEVVADRVVDDGDLLTSGGVTSGIDLALWLVERELGADLAEQISRVIEYPWFRPSLPPPDGVPSLFVVPVEMFEQEP
jgi:transcriptional regulator GlxA family with amidase domain